MKLFTVLWRMLRLRALAVIILFAILPLVVNGYGIEEHLATLVLITLLLATWYANGTCINDLADEHIDKINLAKAVGRPLANKKASRQQLVILAVVLGMLNFGISLRIDYRLALLSGGMLLLNWLYSMPPVRISYRGVWAPLLLPLGYVAYPFLAALVVQHIQLTSWNLALLAALYISFAGRIVLKDFRDITGDRQYGKRTFIVRYGAHATIIFSAILWSLGSIAISLVFWQHSLLVSAIIIIHAAGIGYGLRKLWYAKPAHQQVIIGSLGRIATVTILCILVIDEQQTTIWHVASTISGLLVAGLAMYGLFLCIQDMRHPEIARVVF